MSTFECEKYIKKLGFGEIRLNKNTTPSNCMSTNLIRTEIDNTKIDRFTKMWAKSELITDRNFDREKPRPKSPLKVRYQPLPDAFIAAYQLMTNEVLVGKTAAHLTPESLEAVLAHEKTHALFSELTEEEQQFLVHAIFTQQPTNLGNVYSILRCVYDKGYFGKPRAQLLAQYSLIVGKKHHIETASLNNNGETEEVDLAIVIGEILAFANTFSNEKDDIGGEFCTIARIASKALVLSLDPVTSGLLRQKGLLDTRAQEETRHLLENPAFKLERLMHRLSLEHKDQDILPLIRRQVPIYTISS